ncbi:hypothetical protein JKP88DRAFT_249846 [Tribonema minus]|uniref:Uncharacterized protein n=1 Tax=Tribonema minus TaxID=303371 RepID=A0A835YRN7_9STRA|nr:hypothetical protein JKP88DRAFT_249846 [Tribonema minus]
MKSMVLAFFLAPAGNAFQTCAPIVRTGALAAAGRAEPRVVLLGTAYDELLDALLVKMEQATDRTAAHMKAIKATWPTRTLLPSRPWARMLASSWRSEFAKPSLVGRRIRNRLLQAAFSSLLACFHGADPEWLAKLAAVQLRDKQMVQHVISHAQSKLKKLMEERAGVMCAVAYACPQALQGPQPSPFPQQMLRKEMLASVQHVASDRFVIKVCAVQAELAYDSSVQELGMRLNVLAWLARLFYNCDINLELIGELCVPSYDNDQPRVVDDAQRSLARDFWHADLAVVPCPVSHFEVT